MTLAEVADKEGKCRHGIPYIEHNGNCIVCCPTLSDQNTDHELRALRERLEAEIDYFDSPLGPKWVARRLREVLGR